MDMVSIIEKNFVIRTSRSIFKNLLCSSFGESAGEAILFLLRKELGCDPFEMLWDNPEAVFNALKEIFGVGTRILIDTLLMRINQEYGLNVSLKCILHHTYNDRWSQAKVKEVRSFLRRVVQLHERKK
ncbi:MAG: hypothetical protein N3F04_06075 [Candidatus Nezhaarchaeota archaeon]|nr:hypothetical protein [Candidatus Nezhaarchaeota archaeon]MDW8050719.1 hypothetical protein [Nitrososphaerota archaeon]